METDLKKFWQTYDKYILTGDSSMRGELSNLLRQVEQRSRRGQLFRPEKGWNEILAWQVLRNQPFIFSRKPLMVFEGEIIIWFPWWDRDVFITRIPKEEFVSGSFLKPGFCLSSEDRGDQSDHEWDYVVLRNGLTDERGLYLPLYESDLVLKLANEYIEEKRKRMMDYLKEHKGWS